MISTNELGTVPGSTVYGTDGKKIGTAGQVYLDDQSGEPEWVTVNTGLFGTNESFVPLRNADLTGDGLTVPYSKDQVKDAPNVDPDNGHLDESEEERLFRHYDLSSVSAAGQGTDAGVSGTSGRDVDGDDRPLHGPCVGHDTVGPDDGRCDDPVGGAAAGRHHRVATRVVPLAQVRGDRDSSVARPVTQENARLEREPITDANGEEALNGPDLTESLPRGRAHRGGGRRGQGDRPRGACAPGQGAGHRAGDGQRAGAPGAHRGRRHRSERPQLTSPADAGHPPPS